MNDQPRRNNNRLFVLSIKNGDNDPTGNSFDKHYVPLVEIKDFNVLIGTKPFFNKPIKKKQEAYEKLLKCQQTMDIQQETY